VYRATIKVLDKVKKLTKIPVVAIGGINNNNYEKLLLNNANLLAISSYVWNNKKLKPLETIEILK
jgi:thiamine-phosphate pyrophosphorylase